MTALQKAMTRSRAVVATAHAAALNQKQAGVGDSLVPAGGMGAFGQSREAAGHRQRYNLFRGWLYAAINARAKKAAGQPFFVGRLAGATPNPEERSRPGAVKAGAYHRKTMPPTIQSKSAHQELEIQQDHVLIDVIGRPNPIQRRAEFVYSFFANLDLTGVSYIVADTAEDGTLEFYSLPSTWVRPDHTDGPFSKYKIVNPKDPSSGSDANTFDASQVARAYLPNPADPMGVMAPAQAQIKAVRIDDSIQASQEVFFDNAFLPSVILTVGKNPMDGVNPGRPRLTGMQRRQIHGAIRRQHGTVTQYGTPAIIDGLIEKIDRWSATQNEMGWEKSEDKVRARILSVYGVNPSVLGEVIPGTYAQAYNATEQFCDGVNSGLEMLSTLMTTFAGPMVDEDERTLIWWEKCSPQDPKIRMDAIIKLRLNDDLTKNEVRAELGFAPDEAVEDTQGNKLLQAVGGITGAVAIFASLGRGDMAPESAAQMFSIFFGLTIERARDIVSGSGEVTPAQAVETLESAVRLLEVSPTQIAGLITERVQ